MRFPCMRTPNTFPHGFEVGLPSIFILAILVHSPVWCHNAFGNQLLRQFNKGAKVEEKNNLESCCIPAIGAERVLPDFLL